MRIKMLVDARGSEDGINSRFFPAGEICETCDELGSVFVNEMKVATLAKDSNSIESKALSEPENKAIDGASENKSKKVK